MDILRRHALKEFQESRSFTEEAENAYILHGLGAIPSRPRWKAYAGTGLLEETKRRMAAGESVLILVPSVFPSETPFQFKERLFMELYDTLRLDPAVLQEFSARYRCFSHTLGAGAGTFYIGMGAAMAIWAFDQSSCSSRGFLFPYEGLDSPSEVDGIMHRIGHGAEEVDAMLVQPLGLMWHFFVAELQVFNSGVSACFRSLNDIEAGTGYGWRFYGVESDNDPNMYSLWSKHLATATVELAYLKGSYKTLLEMHAYLTGTDSSGELLFRDQDALLVAKGHLDHLLAVIEFQSERAKNQMSVLFNLIAQADTKANVELAKTSKELTEANLETARAAKRDSEAMKTIAIMTMLFLPGTFFAALFSMPTLKWDASPTITKDFWVYWAFTLPMTGLIFLVSAAATGRASVKLHAAPGSLPLNRKADGWRAMFRSRNKG